MTAQTETWTICAECAYPYPAGEGCDNPACLANPSLSESRKAAIRAVREREAREKADREMVARARRQAVEWSREVRREDGADA